MRLTNTEETYGLVHQCLHWCIAVLIIAMFAMGKYMDGLPLGGNEAIAIKVWWYSLHKTLGLTVLALIIARVIWTITQPHPKPLHGGLEGFAAKTVHWLLYGSMILMPLTGWLHHAASEGFAPIWWPLSQELPFVPNDATLSKFFGQLHWISGLTLAGSLFLHIAGALKHVVIDKDRTLARMVPGAYEETGTMPQDFPKSALPIALAAFILGVGIGGVSSLTFFGPSQTATAPTPVTAQDASTEKAAWIIDKEKSKLGIAINQMGTAVPGSFSAWNAVVIFDPDKPEDAKIRADVTISSLVLPSLAEQAVSPEFLNGTAHPTARFVSEKVTKTDAGFEAEGTLTLAGTEKPFTLPFTFEEENGLAKVKANAVIQRLDFGVGTGYADDSSVGRTVKIIIEIEAKSAE